jgi:hypothetical protein
VATRASSDRHLWSLGRGPQCAEAVVRTILGVGLELRSNWNGELAHSQVYRNAGAQSLEAKCESWRDARAASSGVA